MSAASSERFLAARVRVTLDCPECASPVPVNGIVDEVLCGVCQAVVKVDEAAGWDAIFTYAAGEACPEHLVRSSSVPRPALAYFLALGPDGGALRREARGMLLEIDARPMECPSCRHALDPAALGREAIAEGARVDAFCPGCGGAVPIRAPTPREKEMLFGDPIAIACETALRGSLKEPESAKVLFSCLGCGAPTGVDARSPRIVECTYCSATSYLPDALWLRLHPAQRKRAFHVLFRVDGSTFDRAMQAARG